MQGTRTWVLVAALALALVVPARAQNPGVAGGAGGPMAQLMGPLQLLTWPEVQKEIDLQEPQKTRLDTVRLNTFRQARDLSQVALDLGSEEREKRFTALRDAYERELEQILDDRQLTRLKQLQLQQEGLRALGRKEVAEALGLTAEQQAEAQRILDRQRQALLSARPRAGKPTVEERDAFLPKLSGLRDTTQKELAALLTDEQKAQLERMRGTPFPFIDHSPDRANDGGPTRRPGELKVGDPAPDFTLADLEGKNEVRLSSFKEQRPVVLVFGSYT